MAKSEFTKKKQKAAIITGVISLLLNVIPMMIFVIMGFTKTETTGKIALSFTAIAALALGVFALLAKANLKRSIFFIVLFGLCIVVGHMQTVIITLGVCNIIDELIISPIHHRYQEDYHTNKQIDKRGE